MFVISSSVNSNHTIRLVAHPFQTVVSKDNRATPGEKKLNSPSINTMMMCKAHNSERMRSILLIKLPGDEREGERGRGERGRKGRDRKGKII